VSCIDRVSRSHWAHDGLVMKLALRELIEGQHRYTRAELIFLRRQMLRLSRSIPPGPERNRHLQIAISLRRLFKNQAWLDEHPH
jgi:hypothetical protein